MNSNQYPSRILSGAKRLVLACACVGGLAATAWLANLPPCEWEDSLNCYWNAEREGNGYGQSFINIGIEHGPSLTIYGSYHHDKG